MLFSLPSFDIQCICSKQTQIKIAAGWIIVGKPSFDLSFDFFVFVFFLIGVWEAFKGSYELLNPLTEARDLVADEWVAGGNGKWPKQEWTLRERCSDLGETLDSWRDATKQRQLVLSSWLRGKSESSSLALKWSKETENYDVCSVWWIESHPASNSVLVMSNNFLFFTALPLSSRFLTENAVKDTRDWKATGQSDPWHQDHRQLLALCL